MPVLAFLLAVSLALAASPALAELKGTAKGDGGN